LLEQLSRFLLPEELEVVPIREKVMLLGKLLLGLEKSFYSVTVEVTL